ncbi:MAG TPA: hypothetical protein VF192_02555 [Longimicrobiales bacterium]
MSRTPAPDAAVRSEGGAWGGAGAGQGGGDAAELRVERVRSRRELDAFLKLPWRIYAGDPAWVPPLLSDQRKVLDRRHPFHAHAEVEYFLAWRGGEAVGRVAALVNRRYNEFHGERTGFFGLFESIADEGVVAALLGAAEAWLRARGMERVVGPMNLSTNDELFSPGVLVDGFDRPPSIMMAHGRPYYPELLEAAGYAKAKDLVAYWMEGERPPERLLRGIARLQKAEGVVVRSLDLRRFDEEVRAIQDVYHSAWERNWGFVPMTDAEFEHLARSLRPVVEPRLCVIAEVGGQAVGFALTLPDYHQVLKRLNGRLLPFGILKFLWYRRKIDAARVLTLGLRPGYRHRGLDAMMIVHIWEQAVRLGYAQGECSWVLEDNWEMRRGIERVGGRVYKTYRVYEKAL